MRPIDADVVIKHIEEYWEMVKLGKPSRGMTAVIQNIKTIINSLPTVDAEPHWIPCSKKLPEYFEPVITWDGHCYFVEKRIPFIRDEDGEPIKGEWWVSDDYEEETDYYPNLRDGAAIAWMPMPKPYEVEE